jgi:hypothetical protein
MGFYTHYFDRDFYRTGRSAPPRHLRTAATRSLVVERQMPNPPEKIWRALTQGLLIEQ